jgi:hypothetical protein
MPARRPPAPRPRSLRISIEAQSRALTEGEAALIARVFGGAIDCARVRINRLKWWMWQPAWVTMAPDGNLWFHPNGDAWSPDFSRERPWLRGHFIHEMVHVWQHQCGVNLLLKRPPFARYAYLPLAEGKAFTRYGLEQQAEIVKDAYLLSEGLKLPGRPSLDMFRELLPFPLGMPTVT